MKTTQRARVVDAAQVLNAFVGDFLTGVMVLRDYDKQYEAGKLTREQMIPIGKMCLSNVVLAFAKFEEFWKHYHDLVPTEHRDACKAVLKSIRTRKITEFRNKYVGHIWDNEKRRPLAPSEVMSAIESMAGSDFDSFLRWINNPQQNTYPNTVISIVEAVRDALMSVHRLQPQEVISR